MANPEHLSILKQGVATWNQWPEQNPDVLPDVSGAHLSGAHLSGADLSGADLGGADLGGADLSGANLSGADLDETNLSGAGLSGADLSGADLIGADLRGANLVGADLGRATMAFTVLGDVDLSEVTGLDTVDHWAPSTIGIDTIYKSQGNIPEGFLRGAGVPDSFITYMRSLTVKPIEWYSCFISYSSLDDEFARRLYVDLQSNGVRCWFAPEDMKIGDRISDRIDQAIRLHDKLLLVLSENSIYSEWVEREVQRAFRRESSGHAEGATKSSVLFPIRLDDAVMQTNKGWAQRIRDTRHIGDFSRWKEHDFYQQALARLLRDLQAGGSPPDP